MKSLALPQRRQELSRVGRVVTIVVERRNSSLLPPNMSLTFRKKVFGLGELLQGKGPVYSANTHLSFVPDEVIPFEVKACCNSGYRTSRARLEFLLSFCNFQRRTLHDAFASQAEPRNQKALGY